MGRLTRFIVSMILLVSGLTCLSSTPVRADSAPPGPFEQVGTITIPAGYAEILGAYERSLETNPSEALKDISDKLNRYNQAIGRIAAVVDVGGKLYAGDLKGAAISTSLTTLGELASSNTGKALLDAAGLTTLPVTTFIVAVQIWQASEAALESATAGRQLESLYGSIEADPVLKNTKRALGTGDPIPVTQESIEYLWRKILMNQGWRKLFKVYVTSELGQTWPEPSYWERWTLPGNNIEDAALFENQKDYKSYIAGLLSYLNHLAKKRESQFVMGKTIRQMQSKFQNLKPEAILRKYVDAIQQLPKVESFIADCPGLISRGLRERNYGPLQIVIDNSKSYAVNVLAFLPATGPLGEKRTTLMAKLKANYSQAWAARGAVQASLMRESEAAVQAIPSTGGYHAQRVSFALTFGQIEKSLETEYLETGLFEKTHLYINAEYDRVFGQYDKQKERTKQEYLQKQQLSPVPEAYNEAHYDNFYQKLTSYRSMDQMLQADFMTRVNAFEQTLKQRTESQEDTIYVLYNRMFHERSDIQNALSRTTEVLARYGLQDGASLPNANYVGLLKLDFPQGIIDTDRPLPSNFISPIIKQIRNLQFTLPQGIFHGQFSNYSPTDLISIADQILEASSSFVEQEPSIARLQEDLQTLNQQLQEYQGPPSNRLQRIEQELGAYSALLKNSKNMLKRTKSLIEALPTLRQTYETVADNLDKDISYLERLKKPLVALQPILTNFSKQYRNTSVAYSSKKGPFLFNPDVVDFASRPSCSTIDHSPTLMTTQEIKTAKQKLQTQLQSIGILWLDQKYNIALAKYIDFYINRFTALDRAKTPEHYQFIERGDSCYLHFNDEFDTLREKIEALKITSLFPDALDRIRGNGHIHISALQLDLDPENQLAFAKRVIRKSWDQTMRTSIKAVVDAFSKKRSEYWDWQEKEAYFQEQVRKFEDISGKFGNLEYNAGAANNAMASNDKLIQLYEKAAAMQPTVEGFLSSSSTDPKLSSDQQGYFSRLQPKYKNRFYFIGEMLRNLKLGGKSASQGQQQAAAEKAITAFYAAFQKAYEAKDESQLLSYLSDDWEAGDGTTLFDVEDYFHNMFNVFDEIQMQISGLNVQSSGNNRFQVSYETLITGRIFADGLEHEEKSSVTEEVEVSPSGEVKIIRTPQGRFWYVK